MEAALMPAHGHYGDLSPVRCREGEFELRCMDCAQGDHGAYWPLTLEFWNPRRGMQRCRACWTAKRRRDEHARRLANPASTRERNRAYALANREVLNLKRRARRAAAKGSSSDGRVSAAAG